MTSPKPTAWAHLPNARHIDGIIADAKARPEAWRPTSLMLSVPAWTAARAGIYAASEDTARAWDAIWGVADNGVSGGVWDVVTDTLAALAAWPDSARMLYMTPAALRTLIDITEGDVKHQAVLILPAVLAGYVPTEGG